MKIEINAKIREAKGTGASRRLRHAGKIPGILYGGTTESKSIVFDCRWAQRYPLFLFRLIRPAA